MTNQPLPPGWPYWPSSLPIWPSLRANFTSPLSPFDSEIQLNTHPLQRSADLNATTTSQPNDVWNQAASRGRHRRRRQCQAVESSDPFPRPMTFRRKGRLHLQTLPSADSLHRSRDRIGYGGNSHLRLGKANRPEMGKCGWRDGPTHLPGCVRLCRFPFRERRNGLIISSADGRGLEMRLILSRGRRWTRRNAKPNMNEIFSSAKW
jgi:hypothetical protein